MQQNFSPYASDPVTEGSCTSLNAVPGYVSLKTSHGDLNLELNCEAVPKTCENFLKLCAKNYYNGTKFHRSIKHFMVSTFQLFSIESFETIYYLTATCRIFSFEYNIENTCCLVLEDPYLGA